MLTDFVTEPQWVAWRNEDRDGKPTKVPYVARDRRAEADDRTNWLTHDKAAALAEAIINGGDGGIGIELGKCGNVWLAGIDLDTCRDPATGDVEPWAQEVLNRLGTYSEVSPSGTGIKAFLLIDPADISALRNLMRTQHGRQFKRTNGSAHPPAIELYVSNRYFAVTWQVCDDIPNELRLMPLDELRWLIEEAGPAFAGKAKPEGDSSSSDTILARLNTAAAHNKALETALRNAATMKGGSRSEGALGLGSALKRAGWSYQDMKAALLACPATREWATEKLAEGERQFERIWQEAHERADDQRPSEPSDWPEPVDFMVSTDLGAPILTERHVPPSLWPFIVDNAERMGVATSSVALCAIVSAAAAINEEWKIQPKRNDWDWVEGARLWGAIVGPPSVLKSPIIALTTKPIEMLDIKAHEDWSAAQRVHEAAHAAWKDGGKEGPEPRPEPCDRYLVESVTIEALSEVLRDDSRGKLRAPLAKVLCRQDELSEFLGNMDKYTSGKGNSDRPAWLRAYNGGRHTIDRIGRGSFPIKSWSCCLLGGIQPDVIRRIVKQGDDDGLIQRLMLDVPGPTAPGLDRAPDRAARDRYHALFPALVALHPVRNPGNGYIEHVTLHTNAHAAREDIDAVTVALAAMPDASTRLQTSFGKWPGLFARLCLVFHLIEVAAARLRGELGPVLNVVTAETAERVRRYMRGILAPNLRRADAMMFATVQTEHAASIARLILAERMDRITMRDLMRYGPLALRSPEDRPARDSVMEGLCLFGWLRPVLREAQPPIAWTVNPEVHVLFADRAEAERVRRAAMRETISRAFGAQAKEDC